MTEENIRSIIEAKLKECSTSVRNKNAISAILKLFPPANALWQVLCGAKNALETKRGCITQDVIIQILLAIDEKLESGSINTGQESVFQIFMEGVKSHGNVTGLKVSTSNSILRQLFSEKDVNTILRDIHATGNVIGVDLTVDAELELKKQLYVQTDVGSVKFNPKAGKITFGKRFDRDK
ncbi:MAG: hypothetical protein ABIH42_05490 [Planctomycetota bacterium]